MNGPTCRRLTSSLTNYAHNRHVLIIGARRAEHSLTHQQSRNVLYPPNRANTAVAVAVSAATRLPQVRGKKRKSTVKLEDLPQGRIGVELPPLPPSSSSSSSSSSVPKSRTEGKGDEDDEGPAYPTVVLQAHRNMRKFENCVLLTRVGGFYELYLEQAEEYGPLLNIKVAHKKTNAGPIPMAGFPFFQLDRFLKTLVLDLNCYVAIAEEFPNDPGDKVKSGGLMHDRRVTRIITPGTLIDENFIDPYANNYVMAVHVNHQHQETDASNPAELGTASSSDRNDNTIGSGRLAALRANDTPIGLAWIDVSTGQFYTQSTTVTSLGSILSRVGPREVVVDEGLESQKDHQLFSVLAEEKHLITFAPHREYLPLAEWSPMLESDIPVQVAQSFTTDEVRAGSLLLQYVRDRLQGLSMKLQPPLRHDNMSVMLVDKSTMRSLEIKQTIRDGTFRGSLLHAIRRTVTKGGARLLNAWLSAPSTSLETIKSRLDLVEYFIRHPDLRDEIVLLLRRSHDSQRLVQKFALGRGDPDDLIALANTIRATQDIVSLLKDSEGRDHAPPEGKPSTLEEPHKRSADEETCFASLLSRIKLEEPANLADRIRRSIDEEGLVRQHRDEDSEATQLITLAEAVVDAEGTQADASSLPKGAVSVASKRKKSVSIRDHYAAIDDNLTFVMKPKASSGLRALHAKLSSLLQEKSALADSLRERFGAASLTLRWTPTLGHICHVKGARDTRKITADASLVSSSRSTRAFHVTEWTHLGQRIHQIRFEIQAEEQRIFADLRALVVANLVKLRRNAAVLDELDVLAASFARLAAEQNLTRPILSDDATPAAAAHVVVGGRHPTVEGGLREQGRSFTKNDCLLGSTTSIKNQNHNNHGRLQLITGPNMAGKSTYLRQNALITILAQAGCYVPADYVSLPLADAVFSRVGSADNLYADQSTFMVEMLETAAILHAATPRSFVIMDEVGRGTTPGDGVALAFAALHHLVTVNRCRTLFATHFHGIADLVTEHGLGGTEGGGPVEMYCTDVEETSEGTGFVYVHKLRKGVNRQSHALKVARLANLPEVAITMASDILEKANNNGNYNH
ncbi:MutS protein 1 [Parahypoxylon ruwenzoriense]